MAKVPDIAIIGPGKVGTAIGVLAARAGLCVAAVGGGRRCSAQSAARAIGPGVRTMCGVEAAKVAGLVLLTVPDDIIEKVCTEMAGAGAFRPGMIVAHCSGSLGSDVLAAAARAGAETGSMHPLQTFPTLEAAVDRLKGAYCFIEGTPAACAGLRDLATAIGARAQDIASKYKALYHAAAVLGCNYLVTLLDAAAAAMAASLPESAASLRQHGLAPLEPLVRATIDNVMSLGTEAALTGPVARGDAGTVASHLQALEAFSPEIRKAYAALGRLTVDLALRKGTLSEDSAQELLRILGR